MRAIDIGGVRKIRRGLSPTREKQLIVAIGRFQIATRISRAVIGGFRACLHPIRAGNEPQRARAARDLSMFAMRNVRVIRVFT